jgi:hypothetical protein
VEAPVALDRRIFQETRQCEAAPVESPPPFGWMVLVKVVYARKVDRVRTEKEPQPMEQPIGQEVIEVRIDD